MTPRQERRKRSTASKTRAAQIVARCSGYQPDFYVKGEGVARRATGRCANCGQWKGDHALATMDFNPAEMDLLVQALGAASSRGPATREAKTPMAQLYMRVRARRHVMNHPPKKEAADG